MNPQYFVMFAVAVVVFVFFVFAATWASRFVRVRPNQVLIVSGRKVRLPDGTFAGARFVKSGGTFVFPIVEQADVLSLEVVVVEMPGAKAQTADGRAVQADCSAQVKINSDDASLALAAEHFLNKSQADAADIVRPVLEKHLSSSLARATFEAVSQNPAACAALVETAAVKDLGQMGLKLISFSIREARAA